jgi:hypothetical protein
VTLAPSYGLLTNPSDDISAGIASIYDLGFDNVEIAIEGPEDNPQIINSKKNRD